MVDILYYIDPLPLDFSLCSFKMRKPFSSYSYFTCAVSACLDASLKLNYTFKKSYIFLILYTFLTWEFRIILLSTATRVSANSGFFDMNSSHMHERRFLQRLNIYHCKTVKLFQMYEWPEFMWTCLNACVYVSVCVCVCVPDAWKACCVVNSTSLKHWAAGQQLVCDSFYWNYLFLITIESKFNLFHKLSVRLSFFEWWNSVYYQLKWMSEFWKVIHFILKNKTKQHSSLNKTQANHREYISINFSIKITRSHFTKKFLCNFDLECPLKPGLKLNTFTQVL